MSIRLKKCLSAPLGFDGAESVPKQGGFGALEILQYLSIDNRIDN
jgi:hypothetical protein